MDFSVLESSSSVTSMPYLDGLSVEDRDAYPPHEQRAAQGNKVKSLEDYMKANVSIFSKDGGSSNQMSNRRWRRLRW